MQNQRQYLHYHQLMTTPLTTRKVKVAAGWNVFTNSIFWVDRWIVCTKHYWKAQALNSDRRVMIRKARSNVTRMGHHLKRLQRRKTWKTPEKCRERRIELANRFQERLDRRERKLRKARQILVTPTCQLWNCKRRRGIREEQNWERMTGTCRRRMKRCTSRVSVLSDLSTRTRTPILTLRSSPFLNDHGFQTGYNV